MKSIYEYTIFKDLGLIVEYLKGTVDNYLIHLLAQKIFQDRNFHPDQVFLIDLKEITMTLHPDSVKDINDILDGYSQLMQLGDAKKVALLANPELQKRSNDFLPIINSNLDVFEFKIFLTVEDALAWLEISSSSFHIVQGELNKLRSLYKNISI